LQEQIGLDSFLELQFVVFYLGASQGSRERIPDSLKSLG